VRYFEDFQPGAVFELGSYTVTADEIIDFARQFDPQPFHLDEEAAAAGPFGGLAASGWHTAALFMRIYVTSLLNDAAGMGSPGVEEMRWLHPVRPGDTLTGRMTVLEAAPSRRRPDRGTLRCQCELVNQEEQAVLTMTARGFFGRRPA
jgi:acyl dehydratase